MSTKQERADQHQKEQDETQRNNQRKETCSRLEAVVLKSVLLGLGRPANFLRGNARQLWDNRYRVNVFVGPDAASAKVAHSFFLETDGDGKILTSCPPVTRAY